MKDDEVIGSKAAAANMDDRRQLTCRDRVVRRFDASCLEAQARRESGERQKVRAIAVEYDMAGKGLIIERNTVMRRHGRDGGEAAVIVLTLPDDGWSHEVPDLELSFEADRIECCHDVLPDPLRSRLEPAENASAAHRAKFFFPNGPDHR